MIMAPAVVVAIAVVPVVASLILSPELLVKDRYIYTHIYICGCTYSNVCAGRCYESRQTYKLQLVARSLHLPEHPPPQMFVSSYLPDSLATSCYSHVLHLELFLVAWDTILTSLSHGFH